MKALIHISPVEFSDGFVTIAIPNTPLYRETVEVRNSSELLSAIDTAKQGINADGQVFIYPLNRKFNGFAKWKEENRKALYIHTDS